MHSSTGSITCNNIMSLSYIGKFCDYGFDDVIINKERVIVAVNCGGHGFTDGNGIVFSEDQYFGYNDGTKFGGGGGYYHVMNGKKDKSPMYMSCRSKHDNFWYSIPVPNGDFVVSLAFEEILESSNTKRLFDVLINDEIVLLDFNPYAVLSGTFKNGMYHFPVTVTNHILRINFTGSNPMINGIIVREKMQSSSLKSAYSSKFNFLTEEQMKSAFTLASKKHLFLGFPHSGKKHASIWKFNLHDGHCTGRYLLSRLLGGIILHRSKWRICLES